MDWYSFCCGFCIMGVISIIIISIQESPTGKKRCHIPNNKVRKMAKDKVKRIQYLKKKVGELQTALENRKKEATKMEWFTQMLLKEGRTTKEELNKYFTKKEV